MNITRAIRYLNLDTIWSMVCLMSVKVLDLMNDLQIYNKKTIFQIIEVNLLTIYNANIYKFFIHLRLVFLHTAKYKQTDKCKCTIKHKHFISKFISGEIIC